MDANTQMLLSTLVFLLVTLLQFLLQRGSQTERVTKLEKRLAVVEALLSAIQHLLE